MIRLNLGSGPAPIQGYVNIDLHHPSADICMNVLSLEYADDSIDEIYSSHLLEHFGKDEVPQALKEWHRVLKPGGLITLNLPNLEWCLKNWLSKSEIERWQYPLDTIFGNQLNPGEFHKTGFSQPRLRSLLEDAGFRDINISDHWSHQQSCYLVDCVK